MKKILLFLSCIVSVQLEAISIKDKITNLRKALAVHAQSETKTWELLEELDKRLAHIETRISQPQISEAPCQPIPEALPQVQPKQEQQRTHTLNRLKPAYTPDPQQVDNSELIQSHANKQNLSQKTSYFKQKAAYFNSLLNSLRNHVKNNAPVTMTAIPQHTIMQGSDSEPKQVMLKRRRNCRQKKLTHSADADRLSRAEKRRLRRWKRHAEKPIVFYPALPSNRKRRHHSQLHANAINPNSVHHMNRSKKNHRRFKQHSMPLEEMQPVQPREHTLSRSYPTQY